MALYKRRKAALALRNTQSENKHKGHNKRKGRQCKWGKKRLLFHVHVFRFGCIEGKGSMEVLKKGFEGSKKGGMQIYEGVLEQMRS